MELVATIMFVECLLNRTRGSGGGNTRELGGHDLEWLFKMAERRNDMLDISFDTLPEVLPAA